MAIIVLRKLITHGTFEVNKDIVDFLTSHWYEFCCHQFGNTVVQTSLRVYKAHTLPFAELIMSEALSLMQVVSPTSPLLPLSLPYPISLSTNLAHM